MGLLSNSVHLFLVRVNNVSGIRRPEKIFMKQKEVVHKVVLVFCGYKLLSSCLDHANLIWLST